MDDRNGKGRTSELLRIGNNDRYDMVLERIGVDVDLKNPTAWGRQFCCSRINPYTFRLGECLTEDRGHRRSRPVWQRAHRQLPSLDRQVGIMHTFSSATYSPWLSLTRFLMRSMIRNLPWLSTDAMSPLCSQPS